VPRQTTPESQVTVLHGWKEVAHYLRMGIRTVQRYERTLDLPVRRADGKARASVTATKADLDAWVNAAPYRRSPQLSRPQPASPAHSLEILRTNLARGTHLRKEMARLGNELRFAVERLRTSFRYLETDVRVQRARRATDKAEYDRVNSA